MDVVSAHWKKRISFLVKNVLVVEEEFICFQKLLFFKGQFVCINVVLHYLRIFQIVITYCLPSKHYHCVLVDHVQSYQPDFTISDKMKSLPRSSVTIILLYCCSVWTSFKTNCINESFSKSAAIRTSYCLSKGRYSLLMLCSKIKELTLLQVLPSQRPSNDENLFIFLSNSKINPIIHHFSKCFELFGLDIELKNLRRRNILWPVKLICFITTNYQYVAFVYDNYLSFTYQQE